MEQRLHDFVKNVAQFTPNEKLNAYVKLREELFGGTIAHPKELKTLGT